MKVLSLFDGMSCGMLAMLSAGVEVEKYVAYEIDKYAVTTSLHNFPQIEQKGDVFTADFTQYQGFDFLVGGSPCTYWSIAQKNNRETTASGLGWELFSQYVRALRESKSRYFIYENNKSMSKAIRDSIRGTFGFEEICINSALVSAQNRQRFYWVGKYNPATDWYDKVDIQQPEDRGILLKDVLDGAGSKELTEKELTYMVGSTHGKFSDRWAFTQKPGQKNKAECIVANISKGVPYNVCCEPVNVTTDGKAKTLRATCYKDGTRNMVGNDVDRKTCVAEPVRIGDLPNATGTVNGGQSHRIYSVEGVAPTLCARPNGGGATTGQYAVPVDSKTVLDALPAIAEKRGYLPEMFNAYNCSELTDKAPTLSTGSMVSSSCAVNRLENIRGYAAPCDWAEDGTPLKAVSGADGKTYTVYRVQDGQITIKGKSYPIKLADGYYIIRKLTVSECKRLQTVPEWYDFSCVSPTQAYKMLGNGWTVEVIAHLIRACMELEEPMEDWML